MGGNLSVGKSVMLQMQFDVMRIQVDFEKEMFLEPICLCDHLKCYVKVL